MFLFSMSKRTTHREALYKKIQSERTNHTNRLLDSIFSKLNRFMVKPDIKSNRIQDSLRIKCCSPPESRKFFQQ